MTFKIQFLSPYHECRNKKTSFFQKTFIKNKYLINFAPAFQL